MIWRVRHSYLTLGIRLVFERTAQSEQKYFFQHSVRICTNDESDLMINSCENTFILIFWILAIHSRLKSFASLERKLLSIRCAFNSKVWRSVRANKTLKNNPHSLSEYCCMIDTTEILLLQTTVQFHKKIPLYSQRCSLQLW